MPHYIPYLILVLLFGSLIVGMILRERRVLVFVMQVSFAGMIYVFESIVLVMLDAYAYHPHILSIPYLDSIIGAIVSNFISVPAAAVLIAVYQLNWRWKAAVALFFGGIDWAFVQLGVYEHHWWKTPYTIAGIFVFCLIADHWARRVYAGGPFYIFTTAVTYTFCLLATASYFVSLTGMRLYKSGLFEDPYRDDLFVTVILGFINAFLIVCAVFWSQRRRWLAAGWLPIICLQYTVHKLGVVHYYTQLWIHTLTFAAAIVLITWLSIFGLRVLRNAGRQPIGRL